MIHSLDQPNHVFQIMSGTSFQSGRLPNLKALNLFRVVNCCLNRGQFKKRTTKLFVTGPKMDQLYVTGFDACFQ